MKKRQLRKAERRKVLQMTERRKVLQMTVSRSWTRAYRTDYLEECHLIFLYFALHKFVHRIEESEPLSVSFAKRINFPSSDWSTVPQKMGLKRYTSNLCPEYAVMWVFRFRDRPCAIVGSDKCLWILCAIVWVSVEEFVQSTLDQTWSHHYITVLSSTADAEIQAPSAENIIELGQKFPFLLSPWYNRTVWLGVKHEFAHLLPFLFKPGVGQNISAILSVSDPFSKEHYIALSKVPSLFFLSFFNLEWVRIFLL